LKVRANKLLEEKQKQVQEQRTAFDKSITYDIDTIVMNSKDNNTGAVGCMANITIKSSLGSASKQTAYQVEATSDGQTIVSISGL
jgi:hypothetical protein